MKEIGQVVLNFSKRSYQCSAVNIWILGQNFYVVLYFEILNRFNMCQLKVLLRCDYFNLVSRKNERTGKREKRKNPQMSNVFVHTALPDLEVQNWPNNATILVKL